MIDTSAKSTVAVLGELIFELRRKIGQMAHRDLSCDMTWSQADVLMFIGLDGHKSMDSIAKHMRVRASSATVLIEKLEKKGFIERLRSDTDRRIVNIRLTAGTRKQMTELISRRREMLAKLMEKLDKTEKRNLVGILTKLTKE